MKLKTFSNMVVLLALTVFGSGCCTLRLMERAERGTRKDTLHASAVYQHKRHRTLAVEVTLHNESSGTNEKARYLIIPYRRPRAESTVSDERRHQIPREDLWTYLCPGDEVKWAWTITIVWPRIASETRLRDQLSPEYEKVFDLPGAVHPKLDVPGERHPNAGWKVLMPLTVAADIATSPLQVPWFLIIALNGPM